jgi:beta-barrel assembly-enhancing protease
LQPQWNIPQVQMIATVANQITLTSGVGSAVYLVEMSDPAMVNAFAWRDKNGIGYIYVTLPMARQLGYDPNQWAALLGHEAGHLAKDHQKANTSRQATLQGTATALGFIPLPLVGAIARSVVMPVAATAINAHYSRDQEREADALSVQYMVAAGYDPQGAIHLQQTLLAVGGGKGGDFFSSHPGGQERIANLKAQIAKTPPHQANQTTEIERQFDLERARQSAEQDRLIRESR